MNLSPFEWRIEYDDGTKAMCKPCDMQELDTAMSISVVDKSVQSHIFEIEMYESHSTLLQLEDVHITPKGWV